MRTSTFTYTSRNLQVLSLKHSITGLNKIMGGTQ
jgi:hypothetical protein